MSTSPALTNDPRIVVALDFAFADMAIEFIECIDPSMCKLKIGKELFTSAGPRFVEQCVDKGYDVFLDLKFHDIPTTVRKACEAASRLGVWMLNVHASGGIPMMEAALEGVEASGRNPLLIAVTVLTSMDQATLQSLGVNIPLQEQVLHLASFAQQAKLHGVVCSAQEAPILRNALGKDFCLVTPGIRPVLPEAKVSADDQSRVVTPAQAIKDGAHYLVIGRPITQAENPTEVLNRLNLEIANALQVNS